MGLARPGNEVLGLNLAPAPRPAIGVSIAGSKNEGIEDVAVCIVEGRNEGTRLDPAPMGATPVPPRNVPPSITAWIPGLNPDIPAAASAIDFACAPSRRVPAVLVPAVVAADAGAMAPYMPVRAAAA